MAADNELIFEGTRWQTARAVPAGSTLFEITATGRGRKWATDTTLGFWRSFAEIPLNDGGAIASFVQRYGDPWNELDVRKPAHTARWGDLAAGLTAIADAWDLGQDRFPATDVSLFGFDPKRTQRAVQAFRDNLWPQIRGDLRVDLGTAIGDAVVVPLVGTLAAFMVLSAARSLQRRVPMRRCEYCGHWLEMDRRDQRFCSSSCRSYHSQQRKDK
jgi:hypothetical protein